MARKSRLDQHREEIIRLLNDGWTPAQLSRKYKLTYQGMRAWIIRNGLSKTKNATLKRMRAVPENDRGIPLDTFFGTIYLERAEKPPPMPSECKPAPGKCHRCGRHPIAKGNRFLCIQCERLDHRNPMGSPASVVGSTVMP